jgi:hypothetical protein
MLAKVWSSGRSSVKQVAAWLAREFDARDLVLAAGLALLSIGLALVWMPAAFIAPGAILTYVAIFGQRIARPSDSEESESD